MLHLFTSGFIGKYIHTTKPTPEGMSASGTQSTVQKCEVVRGLNGEFETL